jgi:hypothetical protein
VPHSEYLANQLAAARQQHRPRWRLPRLRRTCACGAAWPCPVLRAWEPLPTLPETNGTSSTGQADHDPGAVA